MRVLMFGWEFPPFKSGGLGTACQGMVTALAPLRPRMSISSWLTCTTWEARTSLSRQPSSS